jgi:hypothetical protein
MIGRYFRQATVVLLMAVSVSIVLSMLWRVPYIFTLVGFAALALIGHDDIPGGWSNPDGSQAFP